MKYTYGWLLLFLGTLAAASVGADISIQSLYPQRQYFTGWIAAIMFHHRWLIEWLIFAGVTISVSGCRRSIRAVFYVPAFLFFFIAMGQIVALYMSQTYLSWLAFENINHLRLVMTPASVGAVVGLVVLFAVFVVLVERLHSSGNGTVKDKVTLVAGLTAAAILLTSSKVLPGNVRQARQELFQERLSGKVAPVAAFVALFTTREPPQRSDTPALGDKENEVAERYGFHLRNRIQPAYPMVKYTIYEDPPPFETVNRGVDQPNIIVFFTEGFSAKMLEMNNPLLQGISPNIDGFATNDRVMVVNNYYNHTAATYRGLHGQLCSLFPSYDGLGGWETSAEKLPTMNFLCLPNIFDKHGYDTVFLDCHRTNASYVGRLMAKLGFKDVWSGDDLRTQFLNQEAALREDAVSDHQLMRALVGFLQRRASSSESRPFFLALYNLETHAQQDPAPDGVMYRDGGNNVTNVAHNFDDAFRVFWDYFRTSTYADTTLVIFTADHSHYPEPGLVKAMGPDFQRYFVDTIPLMVYDPVRKLPKTYDADYATSIDFAPSLLHLLGFPNHLNPFLGRSIFSRERRRNDGRGLAVVGGVFFVVDREKIHTPASPKYADEIYQLRRIIRYTHRLEVTDRIWNPKWNDVYLRSN